MAAGWEVVVTEAATPRPPTRHTDTVREFAHHCGPVTVLVWESQCGDEDPGPGGSPGSHRDPERSDREAGETSEQSHLGQV